MTPPSLDSLTEEHLTGRADAAGEVSWLLDQRLAAYKRFIDQAWPDSHSDEYWRQTPFARLIDTDLAIVTDGDPDTEVPQPLIAQSDEPAACATIVDGAVVAVRLPDALAARGVVVEDLVTAAQNHPELVREHLGSLTTTAAEGTGTDEDRTIAVNDAAWTAGVFLHVPDDVELDRPLGVHVHVTRAGAHLPRVLAVAGRHARARLYLEHTSALGEEDDAVVDEIVETVLSDGARMDVVTLNEWDRGIAHLSLQKAAVHRDATYRHLSVTVGGDTVRLRPEVDLVGPGASCEPLGVYFADEGQHFDLQPYIRHLAPRATSEVLYKGALQGRSRTVFRGNVLVAEGAVGTDTNEDNRTLILTEGARADSTPFLEIFCSDVTAGHGSATGQIDARHLFYLQSRGINREQALRLIVFGFFREVLERLGVDAVEERAMAHIEHEIETADLASIGLRRPAPITEEA